MEHITIQIATFDSSKPTTTAAMIRPVSHHQMQHTGQAQLQSPRKPRVNDILQPTSSFKYSHTKFPKSPIKKHLQNAAAFDQEPSSVGVANASDQESGHTSKSPLHGPLKAKLRASVLQAVLRLLDQDVNALAGAHEVLQAAAALPLAEPSVQRACVQALRELQGSNSMPPSFVYDSRALSNSNWDAYETPVPPPSPRKQAIQNAQSDQRIKSLKAESLHHCKEFLLACANEICDLEDDHSVRFDYAEDTSSTHPTDLHTDKVCKQCGAADFDYASTVQESSDASVESGDCSDNEDDTRADQGSQFSDIVHRAEYMSDDASESSDIETTYFMSMRDREICRQVLRGLHVQSRRHIQRRRSSAPNLALKFRVFEALKLQASLTRKRLAFQRLKTGLRSRPQRHGSAPKNAVVTKMHTPAQLYAMSLRALLADHSDVLLLLLALVFLANLPARYIV
ncbi:unnamed protein product [Phytophthora fragariaefolia]|uniref:Unnamed protein product n=1 Tax=Phytophthora fragariaefolia TaxID=1490495 RepID=A0A9W6XW03_9STRA|nr:unnamed protein product [Phytophthora fragariaefolia]